tara:strand:+ start:99 stop:653 length:555 start_codon:yes stop_codon:yes gene_type:complete
MTPDIQSILHLIAQEGDDLHGCELGVCDGQSFCAILEHCRNVKTLVGIDFWQPYTDILHSNDYSNPDHIRTNADVEYNEWMAHHRVKWSGESHRAELIKKDSNDAVHDYEDETFHFIFVDTYLNAQQVSSDLESWYPKLRTGGLFCGHDYDAESVRNAVKTFRFTHGISSTMSVYDSTFVWRKT